MDRLPLQPAATTISQEYPSQLLLGDCLDLLADLPDNSIDCIVTDPPYGINYQSLSRSLALTTVTNDGPGAYHLLDNALALAWRKLRHNRHVYVFTTWQAFTPMAAIVQKHFHLKNALIWVKNNVTRGDLKGNYGYRYEIVLYAQKGRRYLNGRRDDNILYCNRVPTQAMRHPTEKPLQLMEYLISKSTAEGETILDPFMGSGTTCLAAKRLGRTYIGMEVERVWYDTAVSRLEGQVP